MSEDQSLLPLPPQGADEVADAIKVYLLDKVLGAWRQPSPRELVAELDHEIGVVARWDLVSVVMSLSKDREVATRAMRAYLKSLLEGDALIRALRGEYAPDEDVISTIDAVLRQSAVYRSSKAYGDMVDFMSRFRDYAPYNLMLVRVQNPSCSFFATANDWRRRFRRSVKEDARPMLILAPMRPVMAVYALDDTEGGELPDELTRFATFEGRWDPAWLGRLIQNAQRHLIRVDFRPLSSTNAGFVRLEAGTTHEKFRIVIHEGLTEKSGFGVLCHEMAHIFLGHLGSDTDGWWPARSHLGRRAIEIEAETTVFGVADKLVGRDSAILGVPPEVSVNRLKLAVHDGSDPKLTPVFKELVVPEGTGRLIVMHVYPGIAPYTDTAGRATVRVGKDCKPLTGTLRRKLIEESGENDYTAVTVDTPLPRLVSPAAMELLREAAKADRAPADLLRLGDIDLLKAIGVIRDGKPTRAAVLLAGSPDAVRDHIPGFLWTHLRMSSNTDYSDRADGRHAIPVALSLLLDRIMADNPIETVRRGLYHFEYRTYPETALREALLNALCHGDFRVAGPRLVRQYGDRIEMSNPGGLIGDITPENILHHAPAARNPCLVQALVRLRLVNRGNLGMERIFSALLMEGKPPPEIEDTGGAVRLTFRASGVSPRFRGFVAEEGRRKIVLGADQLLVFRHLVHHGEIDAPTASGLCQRRERTAADVLARMESEFGYIERRGSGPGMYWTVSPEVHAGLAPANDFREGPKIIVGADGTVTPRDPHAAWDGLKVRVIRVIRRCAETAAEPLANADVRRITGLDRHQVRRLIHELRGDGLVAIEGHGRAARYLYATPGGNGS